MNHTQDIENGLTKGLISGYGGKTEFTTVTRGSFQFKSSRLQEENLIYHDEWLSADTGGGQELIKVGDQQFTRLYAGGVIAKEKLKSLCITENDIISFLKETILEQLEKTRLFKPCTPDPKGDWSYSYQLLDQDSSIPITIGKETVLFKNQVVFVHSFLLCPITFGQET